MRTKQNYIRSAGLILLNEEQMLVQGLAKGEPEKLIYSPDTQDWLNCQKLINRLVTLLVNGDTTSSRRSFVNLVYQFLYPKPEFWRGTFRSYHIGPYTGRLRKRLKEYKITVNILYDILNEAESFLFDVPPELSVESYQHFVQQPNWARKFHPILYEMRKLLLPLEKNISVYLHGSIASDDYTPFSDVDDFVMIHEDAWQSYKCFREVAQLLEKATNLFQRVDPLQHHGHWVFLDYDLACLDQSVMPLVVLNNALPVIGRSEIRVKIRSELCSTRYVLWTIIQEARRDTLTMENDEINLYGVKNLIAAISLLPALTFQIRGDILDKKTAILRSEEIFSAQALRAIQWASSIREQWQTCSGYDWIRAMRYVNGVLPFRRSILEKAAKNMLPALKADQILLLNDDIKIAIFQLTNECAGHLLDVVGNQWLKH